MAANTEVGKTVDDAATVVNDAAASASEQIAALRKQVEELYADRQKYLSQAMNVAEGYAARAADTAPNAHQGVWESPEKFFRAGGTRAWASLLTAADIRHFNHRMKELAGDAAAWALEGRGLS